MTQYDNAKDSDFWELAFPSEVQYTFLVTDSTDPAAVVVGGTKKDAAGNLLATVIYKFVMYEEENGNYLIREIYEDPDSSNTMLIRKADF